MSTNNPVQPVAPVGATIPGVEHHVPEEQPAEVAAGIAALVAAHRRT